jgi:TonB family protein
VDTIGVRYALDGLRGTKRQDAEIRRFAGTPLGRRVMRLPSEIIALGNREFTARLKPRLSVLQTMIAGAVPRERPREADFSGPGVAVRDGRPSSNEPLFEFKLDKGAAPIPTAARLRYPEKLRAANVEGEVVVQFVVDTNGRADTSKVKVIRSSHELFTAAVKELLPELRFTPAEVGKHKVSELVQQPFTFSLEKTKAPVARKARRP